MNYEFKVGDHVNLEVYAGKIIGRYKVFTSTIQTTKYLIVGNDIVDSYFEEELVLDKINSADYILSKLRHMLINYPNISVEKIIQIIDDKE